MAPQLCPFKWAERSDRVFLTLEVPDCKDVKISIEKEGTEVQFRGKTATAEYDQTIPLANKVDTDKSQWAVGERNIVLILIKPEGEDDAFWNRLLPKGVKMNNCKIDWDKCVDEDEEDEAEAPQFGEGMDFNSLMQGGGPPLEDFLEPEGGEEEGVEEDELGQEIDSDLPELVV